MRVLRLAAKDWQAYERDLLILESCFDPNLRLGKRIKRDRCYSEPSTISYACEDREHLVAEAFGMSAEAANWRGFSVKDYPNRLHPKAFYFMSIAVLPEYRGLGLANALFERVLDEAVTQGYDFFAGHFRKGASYDIARRHGLRTIQLIADYHHSGLEHALGEIYLPAHRRSEPASAVADALIARP